MSHLLEIAQTKTSDRLSNISLSLSDVVESASDQETPTYNDASSSWVMSTLPQGDYQELKYSKFFATTNTGYTNYSYSNDDYFVWRPTPTVLADEYVDSGVTVNAASSSDTVFNSNGTWKQSITLGAGTYLTKISLGFGSSFGSGSSCNVRLHNGSGAYSQKMHANPDGKFGDFIFGVVTVSSSSEFRLIVSDISGTVDIMEREGRMYVSLSVTKLG